LWVWEEHVIKSERLRCMIKDAHAAHVIY